MKSLEMHNKIYTLTDLSPRLTKAERTQYLIVDISLLYDSVSTMIQWAAKDKVTSHSNAPLTSSIKQRSLRVTNSTFFFEILEVYSLNFIVTGATKGAIKSKISLQDF